MPALPSLSSFKLRLAALLLLGVGFIGYALFHAGLFPLASPPSEQQATENTTKEGPGLAMIAPSNNVGLYSRLYLQELAARGASDDDLLSQNNLIDFINQHQGTFLSLVPEDSIIVHESLSVEEYRAALQPKTAQFHSISQNNILATLNLATAEEQQETLRHLSHLANENTVILQTISIPPSEIATHKQYLAGAVALRNALRSLADDSNDLVGRLMAAKMIDQLGEHFTALSQDIGVPTFFVTEARSSLLAHLLSAVERGSSRTAESSSLPAVAGTQNYLPPSACGFCIDLDNLLQRAELAPGPAIIGQELPL